jgi:DNA polymerase elongation subunit (family B)
MLQASGMAEERGYRVLHGIVDSLWLEGGDGDPEDLCRAVQDEVGIPLHLEGTYKWLVFLPSISTGVGALNRYYGLFESGELKLRGIFLRKGDTTELARDLQNEMLAVFCKACNADQFRALIPAALEVMDAYVERLADGEVPLEKLIIRHRVSKEVEEYTQFNDSFAALKQLQERGFPVPPGRAVEYVVCDGESKSVWQRVKAAAFLDGSERYDADEYTDLLMRASADLLLPFGWSFEALQERARKLSRPANPAWEGEALGRTG